jgi:hypothetical protein
MDEQGNLIDPREDDGSGPGGIPPEMYEGCAPPPAAAAGDDFLNQDTGRAPNEPARPRPAPRIMPGGEAGPRPRPTPQ